MAGEGDLKFIDGDPHPTSGGGDGQLAGELALGTQREQVVPQSKSEHGQRSGDDGPLLRRHVEMNAIQQVEQQDD